MILAESPLRVASPTFWAPFFTAATLDGPSVLTVTQTAARKKHTPPSRIMNVLQISLMGPLPHTRSDMAAFPLNSTGPSFQHGPFGIPEEETPLGFFKLRFGLDRDSRY